MRTYILWLVFILLILMELFWGNVFRFIVEGRDWEELIVLFRLPRVVSAIGVGILLGVSGLVLQTMFENPLAGPYILGISSGSAFFVALGSIVLCEFWCGVFFGILGAFVVIVVIYFISMRYDLYVVVISGVLLTAFFGALINLIYMVGDPTKVKMYLMWLMASLDYPDFKVAVAVFVGALVVWWYFYRMHYELDSLYFGWEYAKSFGFNVKRFKVVNLLVVGLVSGVLTSIYGPISFVGVVVPHIARFYFRTSEHKHLVLGSGLIGSIFVLFADFISHLGKVIIPLNTILSLLGLPLLMIILLRSKI